MQLELVVDQRALVHRDRGRGDDLELEERRGDRLEVVGVGEEREHLVTGARQDHVDFEAAGHGSS